MLHLELGCITRSFALLSKFNLSLSGSLFSLLLADTFEAKLWWLVLILPSAVNQLLLDVLAASFAPMLFAKRNAVAGVGAGFL